MDNIVKALNKLSNKEKETLKEVLFCINSGSISNLDIKKLKGQKDIFRIRKGKIRIIIKKTNNSIKVLTLERRVSKTYKKKKF